MFNYYRNYCRVRTKNDIICLERFSEENMRFKVILEPEEGGGYHIFCPSLKGCHSCGDTAEEALENIKEAIALYLEPDEFDLENPDQQMFEVAV